jgi:hypothetical protein
MEVVLETNTFQLRLNKGLGKSSQFYNLTYETTAETRFMIYKMFWEVSLG